ncbi:expressed protein [Batrachochytrium dendrobatidis JAM81]|uniref:Expressed protein n=1 Tax=Batrachochytrium dendrobatidis (strain JAM81 / FGSC 10211) TaxID=684364 RepID=F4NSW5_BATDJ|nr:uncharacterized protein BATDEDRAFT_36369 [Batrachochytrium dendrobatidis JAM81]EGF83064.1 expressed protein [Batrachochytrium dendrobatidis JAM81]KAJ8331460.1 hypothetical protein O5D80_000378 [Batrachochytrium dendrobatidis]KAK5671905.1 hypothetical protein QVD99_001731 [Batrachochytrium dendrobatidis]|eukprot:XP_006675840.1 expressed protein [Batrachochytrium dendrobatidis JAM81]
MTKILLFTSCIVLLGYSIPSTSAHGLFLFPGPLDSPGFFGATRGYDLAKTDISTLRNPLSSPNFCRGKPSRSPVNISLKNGAQFTITLAFSLQANHIGPCSIQMIDPNNPDSDPVIIASVNGPNGCAVKPLSRYSTLDGPTSQVCPGLVPPGIKDASNDMCMSEWTFDVKNVDKIKCTTCIMRWLWSGQHLSVTDPEEYENCIDVRLSGETGGTPGPVIVTTTSLDTPTATTEDNREPTPSSKPRRKNPRKSKTRKPTKTSKSPKSVQAKTTYPKQEENNEDTQSDDLTSSGWSECKKSDNSSGPYYACAATDGEGADYFACYAEDSLRPPRKESCAPGTSCNQAGNWIKCY